MNYVDLLREQSNNQGSLRERRPGVLQLIAPICHEDGDMVDIFLEMGNGGQENIRICDHGMTHMRLSYQFEIDTHNKERIFQRILSENRIAEEKGNLFLDAKPESVCLSVVKFAQVVAKVSNRQQFRREVIQTLFYEMLTEFSEDLPKKYNPRTKSLPCFTNDTTTDMETVK